MSMKSNVKKRYWAFVLYPESAPENWTDILQSTGLAVAVSPLHDKDLNPDGIEKKSHYHVILAYSGPTTYNNVKALVVDTLGQPIPQPLDSVRGYYRYFTHKDNPEKFQYEEKDVRCLNGFSIFDFVELSKLEVVQIKQNIQKLIRELDIVEYATLLDYLMDNQMTSEYDVATSNTLLFQGYLRSRRLRVEGRSATFVDKDTGEIIE